MFFSISGGKAALCVGLKHKPDLRSHSLGSNDSDSSENGSYNENKKGNKQ